MSSLNLPQLSFLQDEEIQLFADSVGKFFTRQAPAERVERWRQNGIVEREFWREAGEAGLLGVSVPAQYGGTGGDFRHDLVIFDQISRHDVSGFAASLHNGVVTPYVVAHGSPEQKTRWLPKLVSGELIAAIAMSEPGVGSDLQQIKTVALPSEAGYRINGAKTFISSGQLANFIVVVAKTDPTLGGKGVSLLVVEADKAEGFRRGRKLKKIGQEAGDTSELFFDDVWVPAENLLGMQPGRGFSQLMSELPRERLIIAFQAMAAVERALETTLDYVRQRKAFGKHLIEFQNTQFKLAELKTEATIGKVFLDRCIEDLLRGRLDTTTASMAKMWLTDLQGKVVDQCLQFHGGYGYMEEYPIARMYRDARISRIYGGSNEIMKVIIARSL
jgi:acyl-CoA dehydrogenase